jgi:hypothetical protein
MTFDIKKIATTTAQVAAGLVVLGAAIYAGGKLGQIVFKKDPQ